MAQPVSPAGRRGLATLGLSVASVGLATTLPLPLYGTYAAQGGYGAGALALAFAAYAATVILAAPLLGPLPDRIGRRPCVLAALWLAAASTLLLTLAPTLPALGVARIIQGIAMGCATGATASWAAELAGGGSAGADRGARVIARATVGGFGVGGLLTLVAVMLWPGGLRPVTFPAHLVCCAVLLVLVHRLPETLARPIRGAWLRRPAFPPGTWPTTLAILPAWGCTGTVLTSVQRTLAEAGLPLAGPAAACAMMLLGVLAQQAVRGVPPRRAVPLGLGLLVLGFGLTAWGTVAAGLWPLLIGGTLVGLATYAFIYPGGLAGVAIAASGETRARAVAGYFVIAHLGFSVVPLAVGLAVDALGVAAAFGGLWVLVASAAATLGLAIRRGAISRSG
jgi:predicted MFS family arabinose efflux permease